jgi:hypothetical protein
MKISLQALFSRINKWIYELDHSAPMVQRTKPKEIELNNDSTPSAAPVPKDEIVGEWEDDLEDSSWLHALWGYAYVFNEDGTGRSCTWEYGKVNDEHTYTYFWKRLGPNNIEVKMDEDDEGEVLEYTITTVNIPYGRQLYKLTDSSYVPDEFHSDGFWNGCGPVFKHKSPVL